ncbi:hypothetical protein DYB26_007715 [Aphanomyces astaci]|uniref:Uncharacterized protein n=1 Tax=Aphanomyces astaci TaxID=112090 RepID=A0A3R6YK81_APHAT|nr:hypothetical protein DYB26_007715 [Aphanomyces astaci]
MRLQSRGLSDQDKLDMTAFSRLLLSIGNGSAPSIDGCVRLPDSTVMPYEGETTIHALVHKLYGDLTDPHGYRLWSTDQRQRFFAERAILAPKNTDITKMNTSILNNPTLYDKCVGRGTYH